ncbi:MAG: hypothetical protein GEV06_05190 [Luteitalea sp.]|nr:hypothetical protein [Luteitalea sp.]
MVRAILLVLAVTSMMLDPSGPGEKRVTLPAWVSGARCDVMQDEKVLLRQEGHEQRFECSDESKWVSCNFDNAEPIDLPLATLCRARALPLYEADTLVVESEEDAELKIEWLNLSWDGPAPIVATRQITSQEQTSILLSRHPQRLIRVYREGASPLTAASTDLPRDRPWSLPAPVAGAEIAVGIEQAEVRPELLRITGPSTRAAVIGNAFLLSLPAVWPGDYVVTPVYAGGVAGRPRAVSVAEGQSELLTMQAERVGAVQAVIDQTLCGRVSGGVMKITTPRFREIARTALAGTCSQAVAGLSPGAYELSFEHSGGIVARQPLTIAAQQVTSLRIGGARAYGVVLVNGQPAPGVTVEFTAQPQDDRMQNITAVSDAAGGYEAILPEPGTYRVRFERKRVELMGQDQLATISAGDNALDWSIEGGTLEVHLRGHDLHWPVDVVLRNVRPTGPGTIRLGVEVTESQDLPLVVEGLGFGSFEVQARERQSASAQRQKSSSYQTITLDEQEHTATVTLELREYNSTLVLRDAADNPISGARVWSWDAEWDEVARGSYSQEGASPGDQLSIRAEGFMPTCRRVTSEGETIVTLERGAPVEVVFAGYGALTEPAGLVRWPGTDCPVPLEGFAYVRIGAGQHDEMKFAFPGFPRSAEIWHSVDDFYPRHWERIYVGPDGAARVDQAKQ